MQGDEMFESSTERFHPRNIPGALGVRPAWLQLFPKQLSITLNSPHLIDNPTVSSSVSLYSYQHKPRAVIFRNE